MAHKTVLSTSKAAPAVGPYSQGIATTELVFASGQLPIDGATGAIPSGIEAQTRQSLTNLSAVLEEGGASFDTAVKTTAFLKNMSDQLPSKSLHRHDQPLRSPAYREMR